jgi:hypothetical protein
MQTLRVLKLAIPVLASIALASPCSAGIIAGVDLGQSTNYAVLGEGGTSGSHADFEVYQSGTVITGNIGAGPFSDWTHGVDATINGRIDNDSTNLAPIITGTVTGGYHSVSMTQPVADALTGDTTAVGLAPTQTFSTLSEGQTIVGNGGLNVIRVTGDVTLKTSLTLQGGPLDKFVFQLTASDATSAKTLTLSGATMNITGVNPDNILWDLRGVGGSIAITSMSASQTIYGTFLAPDRAILVDSGNIVGRVIGGGGPDSHSDSVSVHSGSSITIPTPLQAVPEPSTLASALAGLVPLGMFWMRRLRNRAVSGPG